MAQEHYYDVSVQWTEDRKGILTSDVLEKEIEVATPPQFAKGVEGVWSPEHLFVAAINSCLMTTFLAIAENFKLDYKAFHSKGTGKLELLDGRYLVSEVVLSPVLVINNEADSEKAERVLQKAEAACLISNSVKTRVTMQPTVETAMIYADNE